MKKAEASIFLDEHRPKKNGKCSVKIKITFNRKRKYFSTGIDLAPEEFQKVMYAKRRTKEQKEIYAKLYHFNEKADTIINDLHVFSFDAFEEGFFEQRNIQNSVSFAFDKYIEQLKLEKRIGTAVSYQCAKRSFDEFKDNLTFAEITPNLLKKYENWMLENDRSISTVGIYTRSLRTIYNLQNIDKSVYPFGTGKNKYSIPTSRNIKKALTVEEIVKIYNYQATPGTTKDMAKDYWLFLYLCNGMNVKDFCLLKWENIDGNILRYKREKTKRSKKESRTISIALKPESWDIIKKWGRPSINKDAYIFPHLQKGISPEKERAIYQQLTKIINKYIDQIASELGIDKKVTTYFARHSFATVLKRSGAQVEMISELLGHSSVNITESYLDSFENEQIQKQTDALTSGFKKAN
ncbi:MAG: site-specific integrase [Bacteroidales bacterium]|nr:site-specific integrase [Bacteroidales bacterium]